MCTGRAWENISPACCGEQLRKTCSLPGFGPWGGEAAQLLLFCRDCPPHCSASRSTATRACRVGRSRGLRSACSRQCHSVGTAVLADPSCGDLVGAALPLPQYSRAQTAQAGRMQHLTVAHTLLPSLACAGRRARGTVSLSAFQNPAHPSKSNSHINASLIFAPEIDLGVSPQLCHHFTRPSRPLANPPVPHTYLWVSFPLPIVL